MFAPKPGKTPSKGKKMDMNSMMIGGGLQQKSSEETFSMKGSKLANSLKKKTHLTRRNTIDKLLEE